MKKEDQSEVTPMSMHNFLGQLSQNARKCDAEMELIKTTINSPTAVFANADYQTAILNRKMEAMSLLDRTLTDLEDANARGPRLDEVNATAEDIHHRLQDYIEMYRDVLAKVDDNLCRKAELTPVGADLSDANNDEDANRSIYQDAEEDVCSFLILNRNLPFFNFRNS